MNTMVAPEGPAILVRVDSLVLDEEFYDLQIKEQQLKLLGLNLQLQSFVETQDG